MTTESSLSTSTHSLVFLTESAQDHIPLQLKHACKSADRRSLDTSRPRNRNHPGIHPKPIWTTILDDKAKIKPTVDQGQVVDEVTGLAVP
ncbi:hypothetical protein AHF37_03423 [Paragonimus kellicotti]|nr:hypothetical protein AHF37_03423 [Paragonimus kellicotti]